MKKYLRILILTITYAGTTLAGHSNTSTSVNSFFCSNINKPPTINCASAPSSSFSQKGRLWVVWAYAGHVYVNHSDDEGISFSQPVTVNLIPEEISAKGENRPKIALDKNQHIYISWTTPLQKRYTGNIRFSHSNNNGSSFSPAITVNDNLDITGHRFDALTVTNNGDIYIAWLDKRDKLQAEKNNHDYTGAAVYYAVSDNHGKSFKPNKKIIDNSCECCRIAIDTDANDLPVMLWRNIYGKNTRDHALVNFKSKDQPALPMRISYDNWNIDACPHHGPDLSIAKNNDYHMVWFNNAKKRHGLFYARRSEHNNKISTPYNFGNYKNNASHPSVLHKNNQVWLSWKEFDGKQETLWLQHSVDNGETWKKARLISSTSNESDNPFLLTHKNSVFIQWQTKKEGYQLLLINKPSAGNNQ